VSDSEPSVDDQLKVIRGAIADLSDGKWDRADIRAIAVLLGALAGLIALGLQAWEASGL
jgi:hypothetical protein